MQERSPIPRSNASSAEVRAEAQDSQDVAPTAAIWHSTQPSGHVTQSRCVRALCYGGHAKPQHFFICFAYKQQIWAMILLIDKANKN